MAVQKKTSKKLTKKAAKKKGGFPGPSLADYGKKKKAAKGKLPKVVVSLVPRRSGYPGPSED